MRSTLASSTSGTHGDRSAGHFRLTSEGFIWCVAALLLAGAGWFKSLNLLLLLGYAMLALLLLNALLAATQVKRVTLSRAVHSPIHCGEETPVRLCVRNQSRRPATVAVGEPGDGSPPPPSNVWFLERLAGGAVAERDGRQTYARRGRFSAASLAVGSGFPFGLLKYQRPNNDGGEVVVLPALGQVDPARLRQWLKHLAQGEGRSRRATTRAATDQADVRGVRPYRSGDSIRWVHWRSSARRGELMVREYDVAPSPELLLVVEPYLPANPSRADRGSLEAALSLAATIVRAWGRFLETTATVIILGDDPIAFTGLASESFANEALTPMADVAGHESLKAPTPASLGPLLKRAVRLVVSSRGDSRLAASLARTTHRPFTTLHPATPPAWYQPPSPELTTPAS